VDDADLEVEIQRELEEEEEALRSAWKRRQRERFSLLQAAVTNSPNWAQTLLCRITGNCNITGRYAARPSTETEQWSKSGTK